MTTLSNSRGRSDSRRRDAKAGTPVERIWQGHSIDTRGQQAVSDLRSVLPSQFSQPAKRAFLRPCYLCGEVQRSTIQTPDGRCRAEKSCARRRAEQLL